MLAKIGVDPAENEAFKVRSIFKIPGFIFAYAPRAEPAVQVPRPGQLFVVPVVQRWRELS